MCIVDLNGEQRFNALNFLGRFRAVTLLECQGMELNMCSVGVDVLVAYDVFLEMRSSKEKYGHTKIRTRIRSGSV